MPRAIQFHSESVLDAAARLGERVRRARKAQGRTLAELEHASRVHRQTLARLEKGDPGVSLGVAMIVLEALGELAELELLLSQPDRPRHLRGDPDEPLERDF